MRINSLLAVLVASLTFAITGCGGTYVPDEAPAAESVQAPEQTAPQSSADQPVTQLTICPLRWTCDTGAYYGTSTQCAAACGSNLCYRDYACTGSCVCP
jgi:hypothetical protein